MAMLVELAGEHGLPPEVALRGTGTTGAQLADPEAEVTGAHELVLVRNLLRELASVPGLGLQAGARYQAPTFGVLGFAMLASPTVGDAVDVAVGWFELSFSFSTLVRGFVDGEIRLVLDDAQVPADVREFNMERDIAAIAAMLRPMLPPGTVAFSRVALSLPTPAHLDLYRPVAGRLGVAPTFGAAATTLVVDPAVLPLPMPQANRRIAELCVRQCAELLQRRRSRAGVAGQVRRQLLASGRSADQEGVARALGMSERTLRRKLADEGTSYRELAAETGGMLAEEFLRSGLTVDQVAGRLGYADASSFTHAFTSWRGVTPGRFAREAGRARQPVAPAP